MREIQLKDAKATLSAVLDDVLRGEEFVITRHVRKEAGRRGATDGVMASSGLFFRDKRGGAERRQA